MNKIIKIISLSIIMLSVNSCIFGGIWAVKKHAEYSENYSHSVKEVYDVVINKTNLPGIVLTRNIYTTSEAVVDGTINTKQFNGKFTIDIVRLTDQASTLTIKYDILGNAKKSREFLKNVKEQLKMSKPTGHIEL